MPLRLPHIPPELPQRLLSPEQRLPLAELPQRWFHQTIEMRCPGGALLAEAPGLIGRIRGALGHVLAGSASAEALAGRPCPWRPPCAYDLLFRRQGSLTRGLPIPAPYVLDARTQGRDLLVGLTLFGFACEWAPAVAEALAEALRNRLHGRSTLRPGLEIAARRLSTAAAISVPPAAELVEITFATPVHVKATRSPAESFVPLVASLGNRVSGMARWQDSLVEADWKRLKAGAEEVDVTPLGWRRAEPWVRYSSVQDREIPMQGWVGTLRLSGAMEPFLPLLCVGATCHVGSHAVLGLGRYEMTVYG